MLRSRRGLYGLFLRLDFEILQVHLIYELMPETLYLTVNIIDRYLSIRSVTRKELQLVGISAMFIASKYEEIRPLKVGNLYCHL
jgi:cyclin B